MAHTVAVDVELPEIRVKSAIAKVFADQRRTVCQVVLVIRCFLEHLRCRGSFFWYNTRSTSVVYVGCDVRHVPGRRVKRPDSCQEEWGPPVSSITQLLEYSYRTRWITDMHIIHIHIILYISYSVYLSGDGGSVRRKKIWYVGYTVTHRRIDCFCLFHTVTPCHGNESGTYCLCFRVTHIILRWRDFLEFLVELFSLSGVEERTSDEGLHNQQGTIRILCRLKWQSRFFTWNYWWWITFLSRDWNRM